MSKYGRECGDWRGGKCKRQRQLGERAERQTKCQNEAIDYEERGRNDSMQNWLRYAGKTKSGRERSSIQIRVPKQLHPHLNKNGASAPWAMSLTDLSNHVN